MDEQVDVSVDVVEPMTRTLPTLTQPFEYYAHLIQYMAEQGSTVHGESDTLRKDLTTFVGGLDSCITQTNNLARAVGKNLPEVGANSAFVGELLENVLSRTPDIALLPVAKALAGRPGWETQPDEVRLLIEEIIAKALSESRQDQIEFDLAFIKVLTTLKMTNGLLNLIIGLLPRDMNAGVSLVGEGASLTLTGHPLAWAFVICNWVIDEVHTALSAAHQAINLYRASPTVP